MKLLTLILISSSAFADCHVVSVQKPWPARPENVTVCDNSQVPAPPAPEPAVNSFLRGMNKLEEGAKKYNESQPSN